MRYVCILAVVVIALTNFLEARNSESNLDLVADKIRSLNALSGFPANPTYAVYKQFSDNTCSQLYQVVSFLENTCLSGDSGSAIITCGRQTLLVQ